MPNRPRLAARLISTLTGVLAVATLVLASVSWVALSRPFDPPQQSAITAPTTTQISLPTYPDAVTVLTYHAVSDTDHSLGTLRRERFAEHMAALAAAGFRTVRLTDVQNLLARRPVALPPRPLLLTFDDGSLTDWTTVDPVLRRYGFTAVAFLTTGRVVAPGTPSFYLSTRQIRSMADSGRWEFGSHTHDLHDWVPVPGDIQPAMTSQILVAGRPETLDQWRRRIRRDLDRSQEFFRDLLGRPATAFSYPFGAAGGETNNPEIVRELPVLLERAGFEAAFTGENVPTGHVNALTPPSPQWLLPRIGVRGTTSAATLLAMIRRAIPVPLPGDIAALPWRGSVADCLSAAGRGVTVAVTARPGPGSCHLDEVNTSQWRDYTLDTHVIGVDRATTAIIAVRDGAGAGHRGRVEVVLGESALLVREQVRDGPTKTLASARIRADRRDELSIEVREDRITVRMPGLIELRATVDPRLREGGVAFSAASDAGRALIFAGPTLSPVP